jgi:hypothetical protein
MKAREESIVVSFIALFQHNTGENEKNQTYVQIWYLHNIKWDNVIETYIYYLYIQLKIRPYVVDVGRRTIFKKFW